VTNWQANLPPAQPATPKISRHEAAQAFEGLFKLAGQNLREEDLELVLASRQAPNEGSVWRATPWSADHNLGLTGDDGDFVDAITGDWLKHDHS
jgi:hypothetical protein